MSYARMMIYSGEFFSVSPEESARQRWEDGVEEDVARLGCRNWKVVALNREG
jgi:hypothetical protein